MWLVSIASNPFTSQGTLHAVVRWRRRPIRYLHLSHRCGRHKLYPSYIAANTLGSEHGRVGRNRPAALWRSKLSSVGVGECGSAQQDFSPQALSHRPASDWSVTRSFSHRESPGHCGSGRARTAMAEQELLDLKGRPSNLKIHFCSCAAMPARRRPTGEPRRLVSCLLNVVRNGFINGFLNVVPKRCLRLPLRLRLQVPIIACEWGLSRRR